MGRLLRQGLRLIWCKRFSQPLERLPDTPDGEIGTLAELPDIVVH